jgi:Ca-activated chloride channel family protein
LTGTIGKDTKVFDYELNFADKTAGNQGFVEDLWARRKVGHLLDQVRVQGESKEVIEEIVTLAKRYGITTPYTSYLLVPDGPMPVLGRKGAENDPGNAPVPQALGRAGGGPGLTLADFAKQLGDKKDGIGQSRLLQETDRLREEAKKGDAKGKLKAAAALDQQSSLQKAQEAFTNRRLYDVQNGKVGVDFAVQNNALRYQYQTCRTASRNVQNRNVVEVGGVWIDDAFTTKLTSVTVKAQSEAYFKILERHPEVKDVYTLGNYVIWVTPSGKALIIDRGAGLETMPNADIDHLFTAPAKK